MGCKNKWGGWSEFEIPACKSAQQYQWVQDDQKNLLKGSRFVSNKFQNWPGHMKTTIPTWVEESWMKFTIWPVVGSLAAIGRSVDQWWPFAQLDNNIMSSMPPIGSSLLERDNHLLWRQILIFEFQPGHHIDSDFIIWLSDNYCSRASCSPLTFVLVTPSQPSRRSSWFILSPLLWV